MKREKITVIIDKVPAQEALPLWMLVKRDDRGNFTYTFRKLYGETIEVMEQAAELQKKDMKQEPSPIERWKRPKEEGGGTYIGYVDYEDCYVDYVLTRIPKDKRPGKNDADVWFVYKYLGGINVYGTDILSGTPGEISEKLIEAYKADCEFFTDRPLPAPGTVMPDEGGTVLVLETSVHTGTADYIAVRL